MAQMNQSALNMNESDDDIDIISGSRPKRKAKGYKLSKSDKLSYFGAGKIDRAKDGSILDLVKIKNEVFMLSHTEDGHKRILETHDKILKDRALGAAPAYEKKIIITKRGTQKEVMVKQDFMAAVKWAKKPSAAGGGSTTYTVIERIVIIAAAYGISLYYMHLKMDPELGIQLLEILGIIPNHVVIMYILSYGKNILSMLLKIITVVRKKI